MAKKQRRYSQNSRYMREILEELREYEVQEVQLLVDKFRHRTSISNASKLRLGSPRITRKPTK